MCLRYLPAADDADGLTDSESGFDGIEDVTLDDHAKSLHRLVEAALSCSSVKLLKTNIPFLTSSAEAKIEHIVFNISHFFLVGNPAALCDCLLCIAKLYQIQSMKSLHISCNRILYDDVLIPYQDFCNFLTVLNDSLHQNTSISKLRIEEQMVESFFRWEELPRIFRIGFLSTRRTISLPDLNTANPENDGNLWPYESCWDLQSCHNMHPLLYKALYPFYSLPFPPYKTIKCSYPFIGIGKYELP